jgi:hypothetical protein
MALNRLATIGLQKHGNGLLDRGFTQSNINACVFFGKGCIILTYVDDCIIVGDLTDCIEALITLLRDGTENFILKDEGLIEKYLGVSIVQLDDKLFDLTKPFLIKCITAFFWD